MKNFRKGWWWVCNICKCVIFAITFQIPIFWFVKILTFVCIHMSRFESQLQMSHSFSFPLSFLKDLPLSIGYSALLSWSSCWLSWRKRKMWKLYEIHILLSFTRKIKPEYEDVDDDGGNYWQHNCQPQLYVGVHLDITITVIQSWIGSIFPQFRVQDF